MVSPTTLGSYTYIIMSVIVNKPTEVLPGQFKIHLCQSCWSFVWAKDSPEIQPLRLALQYVLLRFMKHSQKVASLNDIYPYVSIPIVLQRSIPSLRWCPWSCQIPLATRLGWNGEAFRDRKSADGFDKPQIWCWDPFQVYEFSSEGSYGPIETV